MTDSTDTPNAPQMPPLALSADDLVGIMIHNGNQLVAMLTQRGPAADFGAVQNHLSRMYELAERCLRYQESVIAAHGAAASAGGAEAGAANGTPLPN